MPQSLGSPGRHGRAHHAHGRRRIRYIDVAVQRRLLWGLAALEIGLVAALCWMMYDRLNRIVETNLYRVHLAQNAPLLEQLLHESLCCLGVFLLVNALALWLAHWIWRGYVHAMVSRFLALIGKTRHLDFSPDPQDARYRYGVVSLTEAQRARERHRLAEIRSHAAVLAEDAAGSDAAQVRARLDRLDALLPHRLG